MSEFLDFVLHLDKHMNRLVVEYGTQIYWILALTLFVETGLVITPFLPGDSLLFTAGLFTRSDGPEGELLNVWILLTVLPIACILGDMVNYKLGQFLGHRLFTETSKGIFHKNNLAKTRSYFERHGAKTIVIARFVPIVRALAPFVAGMEGMTFQKFVPLSIVANFLWVWVCVGAGNIFGRIQFVREHFEMILLGLLVLMAISVWLEIRREARHQAHAKATEAANPEPAQAD
ncbi:MAG: VTT domain-containing protein [Armatimonadetes bacterium]|nr:VTT domain-containing protein [Armatimonadota bacterium]